MPTTTRGSAMTRLASAALIVLALVVSIVGPAMPVARAAGTLTLTGAPYAETFDSLVSSSTGTSAQTPAGWNFVESGTNANTTYTAGNGSGTAGDTYSFGGSADRAFGGLLSGSLVPTIGASFANGVGETITDLQISYTGEQWRLGATGRADRLDFQYSLDATSLTTGTWVDVNALDFVAPVTAGTVGAIDGNASANRAAVSSTISGLSIDPGATFWLRWSDFNASGSDDGLAIDDFSLTATVGGGAVVPAITTQPASQTIGAGQTATLSVAATGTAPLSYQWYQGAAPDTSAPVGGDSASFTTPALSATTSYWVRVSNGAGSADSQTATVSVAAAGATPISQIQGSGSAVTGAGPFTVEAIVVGAYQAQSPGQLRGFFLQEEDADADGDPATSEGIFVFCETCPVDVAVGDKVSATGSASEFFGMSQLTASTPGSVAVLSSGNPLPTPATVELPVPGVPTGDLAAATAAINAYFEPSEGMLVSFPDTLAVSEYFELARYGQVILTEGGRPRTFTAASTPSAAGLINHEIDLARRTVILDDTDNRQNRPSDVPNTPYYHPVPGLSTGNYFRGGDTITGLTGVLHWSFAGQTGTDAWRIRPVVPQFSYGFTTANPRPAPPAVDGRLKVASFNVLNYFLSIDTANTCAPTQNQDCRGADSAQELQRQRTKLLAALDKLDADVLGLMEMENTPGVEPLADIVAGLPGYAYVDTGVVGTDAIRVGIIYRTAAVSPVGAHALLTSSVDSRFNDGRNRPALAQTFEETATGARFTVVVNHLKSKGSGCGAGDDDTTTGQGNCNGTRTLAAQALADWLAADPTGSGDPDVLIIGDLNSYAKEDPIVALQTAGYTDLVAAFGGPSAYGYVFDGQLGYLDHALSNASLTPQVADVQEWHINADEIPLLDYNDDERTADEAAFEEESDVLPLYEPNEFRTSDHDPVIVGLDLTAAPVVVAPSITTQPASQTIDAGQTATLSVVATGTAPLSYQWYQGTAPDTAAPVGANSASFTTPTLSATTSYWVQVSNSAGSVNSNTATVTVNAAPPPPAAGVVISQVYGGGGNGGATYTHDFIELYNRGSSPVSLSGLSIQYASATGTGNLGANAGQLTELPSVTLQPGEYYLVEQASNAAVGDPLPTPDLTDATPISMAAGAGKVALVTGSTTLGCNGGSNPCSSAQLARIVDLVGYGNANFFEGAAAVPTLSSTTAALRKGGGATDTDNNSADFTVETPNPRNSSFGDVVAPSITTPPQGQAIGAGQTATLSVVATGTPPLSYQWYAGLSGDTASPIAGANAASYTTPALSAGTYNYWVQVSNSAGTADSATATVSVSAADPCVQTFTPIYNIQGSGANAAITGNVTTAGVVVGDYEGSSSLSGFYLQDLSGDGDPATSDGIFVFTGGADTVQAGDVVRVTGFARERFNQTALNGSNSNSAAVTAANIVDCGTGSVAPTAVELPLPNDTFLERYEGMLIRLTQNLVISEYFNYDRFGEYVLALPLPGEERPYTPTAVEEPGSAALARAALNARSRILIDDALSAQNPSVLTHPNGDPFSLANRFRGGDRVQNFTGVLGYDFNLYRVQPTAYGDYTAVNPRPAAPEDVGGSLKVGAFNTLNYFLTLDPSGGPLDNKCGPALSQECRGADDAGELERQRVKLLAAIAGIDADILGLNELENTTGVEPLADIVAGLNAQLGAGTYAYIETGPIGTDAIKVGMIYKPAVVTPVGSYELLTSADDPRFRDTKNRPVLAQSFRENATGEIFTVAATHLKSKGSDCNDVGDPDAGDGQGNCNITRTLAAQALADWLDATFADPDFLIVGDLNSYAKEDPIAALEAAGFVNLIERELGRLAYSYVFDGQFGYLDHALASASLAARVTDATEWHINADEPDVLDYDTTFKPDAQDALYEPNAYRTSDHDPVIVGLDLNAAPTVDAGGPYSVAEGGSVTVTAVGSDANPGDALTYAWDLDGDGQFDDATGPSAVFSAAGLQAPATRTIAVRVTDNLGLTATDTAVVKVVYSFSGFFQPIDNLPTVNSVKAGSAVPVKFSLAGNQGLSIFAAGYPKVQLITCQSGAPVDEIETLASGGSGLQYNAATDTYTYVWKTEKAWAGRCGQLVIRLNDGTTHLANFRFR